MKRFLAIILAGLMLLSLAACGAKDENVVKKGMLEVGDFEGIRTPAHLEHMNSKMGRPDGAGSDYVKYSNLSAALMDLESGKIVCVCVEECVANYVVARNDNLTVRDTGMKSSFSMMTTDSNKEVYDILNNAIIEMKADGTLDKLIENELMAYINSDPTPKDLPHFDGARTIKVGVTGDLPPMDFVASNGKAAGFNIALLAEIANRAQINIELVQIETGARPMALSSGKVDAVFWTRDLTCTVCNASSSEAVEGTIVTESYFSAKSTILELKSEK